IILSTWTSGLYTQPGMPFVRTIWSPYYRIDYYHPEKSGDDDGEKIIVTNLVSHQSMIERSTKNVAHYELPYLIRNEVNRHAGPRAWPPFQRVLVIGAGSGNDLARVLEWCPPDVQLDAVEIDPVIQSLGKQDHPNRPYDDNRVTLHL